MTPQPPARRTPIGLVALVLPLVLAAAGRGGDPVPPAPGEFLADIPLGTYVRMDAAAPPGPVFDVADFGGVGDGLAVDTAAIQAAIDAAHRGGGGTVRLGGGEFLSGTLELKSGVTLQVARDAVLRASREAGHFGPPHLIHAAGARHVGLEGPGRIVGGGDAWWHPPLRRAPVTPPETFHLAEAKAAHFACKRKKLPGRPSPLIRVRASADVVVRNLVIENAPGWTLSIDRCDRARIEGVVIDNNYHGENTDGIDIVGSRDVDVTRCFISTGDDGIVLKNGFVPEGAREMARVRISDCAIRSAANCIKIGTETWADVTGVEISNCELFTRDIWPWALAAVAIESVDGALVRDVQVRDVTVRDVTTPLFIRLGNRNRWQTKDRVGAIEGITIERLVATGVEFPCVMSGLPGLPIRDVRLDDVRITYRDAGERLDVPDVIPELEEGYPEFWMFGDLPACGLFARHVRGLAVRNVRVVPRSVNRRETFVFDDVETVPAD